jgi:hypothetical protein
LVEPYATKGDNTSSVITSRGLPDPKVSLAAVYAYRGGSVSFV